MDTLILRAAAKINWALDVKGLRADKYHALDMIMDSVSLYDEVTLALTNGPIEVGDIAGVGAGAQNLAWRAAALLKRLYGVTRGVRIGLKKAIPMGAGLGGGSADAAAVLAGLNRLWQLDLDQAQLAEVACQLGADVPFCLRGGRMRAQGIGERLTRVEGGAVYQLIIAKALPSLATPDVFRAYDAIGKVPPVDVDRIERALVSGDAAAVAAALAHANALQMPACALEASIPEVMAMLDGSGARAVWMTGSGSAVLGLYADAACQQAAMERLRRQVCALFAVHTVPRAIEIA
nr:4-(cytidine 5'-diphospho)-2-C-methyl-D-erythritol kinase [Maliibacterium massiliense]